GYSDPTYDYKAGYPRPDEAWAFDANGNIDKEKSAEVSEKIGEWSTYALMLVIPGPEELLIAGFLVKVGGKGGTKLVSKAVTKEVSKLDTPKPHVGIVQSRINLAENPTRFSPSNNAGMKHVRDRHFDPLKNAGQFSISELELKAILQSKKTVNTTVVNLGEGRFERVVDISESIGTVKPSLGGEKTTWLKVITDKAGNVITTFPIPKP
ncbi:hypothetical protein AAG146_002633, partial [Listeria innocua]|nr:hypothetical protein [Listeria innocua]